MTTRKDLQEWLNRFPEDTIIELELQQKQCNITSSIWQVCHEI